MSTNEHDSTGPLLLSVEDAARRIGMGRSWTYNLVLSGLLPSIKLGRSRRIPARAVDDYVAQMVAGSAGGPGC